MGDYVKQLNEFFLKYTSDVMNANLDFLLKNSKETLTSCSKLLSDTDNILRWLSPIENKLKFMLDYYLIYPMLTNIVYPNVQFVYLALLLGALPQAVYTLRTVLEAVGIALYADNKFELRNLHRNKKMEHESVRNASLLKVRDSLIKVFQETVGKEQAKKLVDYVCDVYRQLSAWIHPVANIQRLTEHGKREFAAGLLRAITLTAEKYGAPPSYGVLIPMKYGKTDIEDLKYLREMIELTRSSIALLIYAWSKDKDITDKNAIEEFLNKLSEENR